MDRVAPCRSLQSWQATGYHHRFLHTTRDRRARRTMFTIPDDIRGLIFDCDGTLADTMPLHQIAWERAMADLGGACTPAEMAELAGVPTRRIFEILNERHGFTIDPIAGNKLKESYYAGLVDQVLPIAEVVAVVTQFRGKLPMAVATGGEREVAESTLRRINLLDAFDTLVTADDVEHGKPAPDIFVEAARRIGIAPAQCLVFEDADLGIEGARAAGMRWIDVRQYPIAVFEGRF